MAEKKRKRACSICAKEKPLNFYDTCEPCWKKLEAMRNDYPKNQAEHMRPTQRWTEFTL